jgi:predicted nucleotidyltransferase
MILTDLQQHIIQLLQPYQPARISVFGSYARGEQRLDSDLDILIRFKERIGLLKLVAIEQELSDKMGIKVDLVTENAVKNPRLKAAIEQDLITIFQ